MLKSVNFDENEHAHLIEFINSYRDNNGNNNISSAIRFLMQQGYEHLYGKTKISVPYNKAAINKDEIKKEVMNEILSDLNAKLFDKLLTNQISLQPIYYPMMPPNMIPTSSNMTNQVSNNFNVNNTSLNNMPQTNMPSNDISLANIPEQKSEIMKSKPIPSINKKSIKSDSNSLLTNLLSNANR